MTPYQEGFRAYDAGLMCSDDPYLPGTSDSTEWVDGWLDAKTLADAQFDDWLEALED